LGVGRTILKYIFKESDGGKGGGGLIWLRGGTGGRLL
jgi:hypothetical protein